MTEHTALLVAAVRNEGPHLLEWVAHHRLCGFDRIQIHQNDSTDMTVQTLRWLDRIGAVEFHDNQGGAAPPLARAYRHAAASESFRSAEWCMVLDGDEFLSVRTGEDRVGDLIAACPEGVDTIMVNRRAFGSSGERGLSRDLVTERFTWAEPADAIRGKAMSSYRSLFRTDTWARPGLHLPRAPKRSVRQACNGSGLKDGTFERRHGQGFDPEGRRLAQVNHYALRDLSSWLLKRARGNGLARRREMGRDYWLARDRNEEEDRTLANRAPALWDEMRRLDEMAEGRLFPLRQRAMRHWRIDRDALLENPEIQALRDAIVAGQDAADTRIFRLPGVGQPVFRSVRSRPLAEPETRRHASA